MIINIFKKEKTQSHVVLYLKIESIKPCTYSLTVTNNTDLFITVMLVHFMAYKVINKLLIVTS